jgi:8-oxo-dGTP pyrophosphatase MutT (NUDIX family)
MGRSVPPWFFRQSGVIPFRVSDGKVEILLITSASGVRWIIPKGVVEPGMDPGDSAVKEAFEEAGVQGERSPRPIGSYQRQKWGGECTIQVYLLKVQTVLERWPESAERRRAWLTIDEAAHAVEEPALKELIRAVPALVEL